MSPEETNDTATNGAAPSADSSDSSHGTIVDLSHNRVLTTADLGASKPVPKPPQPKAQPVKFPTVVACEHTIDPRHFPTQANCQDCWDAFFEYNTGALASVHQLLLTGGTQAVVAIHGKKFTKYFGIYLKQQLLKMHQQAHTEPTAYEHGATGLEVPSLAQIGERS